MDHTMRRHTSLLTLGLLLPLLAARDTSHVSSAPTVLTVDLAHPGAQISPHQFGIFFEDINFAADGGLYPELIKNRSFEFAQPLAAWHEILPITATHDGIENPRGEMSVQTAAPIAPTNPTYLRLRDYASDYGIYNTGFRGMGIESGAEYRFSAWIRIPQNTINPQTGKTDSTHSAAGHPQEIRATITDENNHEIASGNLEHFTSQWAHYETILHSSATSQKARINLFLDQPGTIDLDMVSLFPTDTWKHRPNGLRKDLVQLLADMHPGFIRFPGGCIVEGRRLATRYRWKTTVGPLEKRTSIVNRWSDEFDTRPAPDYFQSFGLGFYEYFQLAEDIGAASLPILNCGMACQFNSNETVQLSQLHAYIQDALDLIDFANSPATGPAATPWGKLRAQMGHPEPFHMTMLGVGNEQWGPHYVERYKLFAAALKAKHPEIQLVVSAGPAPSGEPFNSMWKEWRTLHADIVDEHYYMAPNWFLENANRYDHYDRSGPKIFAGEYAAQTVASTSPDNRNNWQGAIAEAAFMTGLERNGDLVRMASYAPLLANVDAWQWKPDAIWFDNLHSYGTPNYYVQRLFASNTGTRILPATPSNASNLYASATLDERTHTLILKLVNNTNSDRPIQLQLPGVTNPKTASIQTLSTSDLSEENSFTHPTALVPKNSTIDLQSTQNQLTLQPYSLTVYRIPIA